MVPITRLEGPWQRATWRFCTPFAQYSSLAHVRGRGAGPQPPGRVPSAIGEVKLIWPASILVSPRYYWPPCPESPQADGARAGRAEAGGQRPFAPSSLTAQ